MRANPREVERIHNWSTLYTKRLKLLGEAKAMLDCARNAEATARYLQAEQYRNQALAKLEAIGFENLIVDVEAIDG